MDNTNTAVDSDKAIRRRIKQNNKALNSEPVVLNQYWVDDESGVVRKKSPREGSVSVLVVRETPPPTGSWT